MASQECAAHLDLQRFQTVCEAIASNPTVIDPRGCIDWLKVSELEGVSPLDGAECRRLWKMCAYGTTDPEDKDSLSDDEDFNLQPLDATGDPLRKTKRSLGTAAKSQPPRKPKFFVPHQVVSGSAVLQHLVYNSSSAFDTTSGGTNTTLPAISICRHANL